MVKILLSSRARMDSALILSLMETAVKVTPAKPRLIFRSCFFLRFLYTKQIMAMIRRSNKNPATAPAMRAAFDDADGGVGEGVNSVWEKKSDLFYYEQV